MTDGFRNRWSPRPSPFTEFNSSKRTAVHVLDQGLLFVIYARVMELLGLGLCENTQALQEPSLQTVAFSFT